MRRSPLAGSMVSYEFVIRQHIKELIEDAEAWYRRFEQRNDDEATDAR